MGIGASSCMGRRRRRGKYRVNEPRGASRNEFLATVSADFGMVDGELCVRYRDFEQIPPAKGAKDAAQEDTVLVDAEPQGDNEMNEAAEGRMGCHNHGFLPRGVGGQGIPHPDLPDGVTCITCAATIMENVQEQGMGDKIILGTDMENTSEASITEDTEGSKPADENRARDIDKILQAVSSMEGADDDNVNSTIWSKYMADEEDSPDSDQEDSHQDTRLRGLQGTRWRRRYNAKAQPVLKAGVE